MGHALVWRLARVLDESWNLARLDEDPVRVIGAMESAKEALREIDEELYFTSDWSGPLRRFHARDASRDRASERADPPWPTRRGEIDRSVDASVWVTYLVSVESVAGFIDMARHRLKLAEGVGLDEAVLALIVADGWDPNGWPGLFGRAVELEELSVEPMSSCERLSSSVSGEAHSGGGHAPCVPAGLAAEIDPHVIEFCVAFEAYISAAQESRDPQVVMDLAEVVRETFATLRSRVFETTPWSFPLAFYHSLDDVYWSDNAYKRRARIRVDPEGASLIRIMVKYSFWVRSLDDLDQRMEAYFDLEDSEDWEDVFKIMLISEGWGPSEYPGARLVHASLDRLEGDRVTLPATLRSPTLLALRASWFLQALLQRRRTWRGEDC
ncbi:MAG TPA: hypothetical protein PLK46_06810 [Propioniciclava sp.]|jgi:hypothetical protein|uniref:hypothetical protein n=1 Tax=Propioniciclava sp. TaxID=2038686 RepID=UPI002C50A53B|nr:hypothetical protein [Propioniciclava sp.]HRL50316.1 hypothetical protein [Propioniciclava sp.]HRL80024.1 hypothetical protein [Propioniciclava sp.]